MVELEGVAYVLRISPIGPCGEADEIDGQNRDELPFLARLAALLEWSTAAVAKARAGRVLSTTVLAAKNSLRNSHAVKSS